MLSLKTCAELHQGRVDLLESPLGGACRRLWLPQQTAQADPAQVGEFETGGPLT